jgi:hypothetical protein
MKFAFTYRGNGRMTGRVCENIHTGWHTDPSNNLSYARCQDGIHWETEGFLTDEAEDKLYARFLKEEHLEFGHSEPVPECPLCR